MRHSTVRRASTKTLVLALGLGMSLMLGFSSQTYAQAGIARRKLLPPKQDSPRPLEEGRRAQRGGQLQAEPQNQPLATGRPFFTRLQILQTLNLTLEQQARIRELRETMGGRVQVLRANLEEQRDALNQAMYADSVNHKAIDELTAAIRETQGQILQVETRVELAFRDILTSEQLKRLRELQAEEMHVRALQRELNRSERALREKFRNRQNPNLPKPE